MNLKDKNTVKDKNENDCFMHVIFISNKKDFNVEYKVNIFLFLFT